MFSYLQRGKKPHQLWPPLLCCRCGVVRGRDKNESEFTSSAAEPTIQKDQSLQWCQQQKQYQQMTRPDLLTLALLEKTLAAGLQARSQLQGPTDSCKGKEQANMY